VRKKRGYQSVYRTQSPPKKTKRALDSPPPLTNQGAGKEKVSREKQGQAAIGSAPDKKKVKVKRKRK
jgi:hypothetical protein